MDELSIEKFGYKINCEIAKGSFSKVYKATYQNKKGEVLQNVAIKVIDLCKTSLEFREKFLRREIETLSNLQMKPHLNIIDIQVRLNY